MVSPAEKLFSKIRIRNKTIREALAEFFGTFILIVSSYFCLYKDKYQLKCYW